MYNVHCNSMCKAMESLEPARIAVHLSRSLQKKSTPSAGSSQSSQC